MVSNAVAAATFFAVDSNAKELWRPTGIPSTQEALPRMAYLPLPVAAFALERQRTPWELLQFIGQLIQEAPTDGVAEEDAELLRKWLLGSLQAEAGKTSPAWVLDLTPVVSIDEAFREWCYHHISITVGSDSRLANSTAPQQETQQGATVLELSLSRMAASWQREL